MKDLVEILGEGNPLSQMIQEQRRLFNSSLQYDSKALADKAGIAMNRFHSVAQAFQYEGKAFRLVFQANLPEEHEHYWMAEVLIGDDTLDEDKVTMLDDDTPIEIIVHGLGGRPISEGRLNLLGLPLAVKDGRTSCLFSDFRNNLTKA